MGKVVTVGYTALIDVIYDMYKRGEITLEQYGTCLRRYRENVYGGK